MKLKITFIFLSLLISSVAYADCTYGGVVHPEGTIIGPYVCSDGKWIVR